MCALLYAERTGPFWGESEAVFRRATMGYFGFPNFLTFKKSENLPLCLENVVQFWWNFLKIATLPYDWTQLPSLFFWSKTPQKSALFFPIFPIFPFLNTLLGKKKICRCCIGRERGWERVGYDRVKSRVADVGFRTLKFALWREAALIFI